MPLLMATAAGKALPCCCWHQQPLTQHPQALLPSSRLQALLSIRTAAPVA